MIALLTPYSGRNLGDGAIQSTFIQLLRERRPDVEIVGLTEDPVRTAEIHGIRCFPLHASARAAAEQSRREPSGPAPVANEQASQPKPRPRASVLARALLAPMRLAGSLRWMGRRAQEWWDTWRLLKGIDLLVVAGGGQLDEEWGGAWSHPYTIWRWTLCARLRGRPVAFASVGLGVMRSRLGTFFIRQALARSEYRSYRDPGTRALLSAFDFASEDPIVPDIALGLPLAEGSRPSRKTRRAVGIVPMIFAHAELWPTPNGTVYARYIDELRRVVLGLLNTGCDVDLFVTNRSDTTALKDLLTGVTSEHAGTWRVVESSSLTQLLTAIEDCRVVIASRLHAIVLAQRLATPMIAISFDRKVEEQMRLAGLSDFCLDIRSFEHGDLLQRFNALDPRAAHVEAQLDSFVADAQRSLSGQFTRLAALLGPVQAAESRNALTATPRPATLRQQ